MSEFKTLAGEEIVKMPDGANLAEDEGWFKPTANPFTHGCCDCGLVHKVQIGLVGLDGVVMIVPEESNFVLRFTRDEAETKNIRGLKKIRHILRPPASE